MAEAKRYIDVLELQEHLAKQNIHLVRFPEATSLTSGSDFKRLKSKREKEPIPTKTHRPLTMGITLTDEQVQIALEENLVDFPKVEKYWVDPSYRNQNLCLLSFVPSKGASPDEDGIFGMFKVRGVFVDEKEAMDRAEYLVRDVDSYNLLFMGEVGRALPITVDNEKYAAETSTIDIREKAIAVIDSQMRCKKRDEERGLQEQKERERELIEASTSAPDSETSLLEQYTTLRTTKANLCHNMVSALGKIRAFRSSLDRALEKITAMEQSHPEFRGEYMTKYRKSCADVGISEDHNPLMKYLVMDGLPFDLDRVLAFKEGNAELPIVAQTTFASTELPAVVYDRKEPPKVGVRHVVSDGSATGGLPSADKSSHGLPSEPLNNSLITDKEKELKMYLDEAKQEVRAEANRLDIAKRMVNAKNEMVERQAGIDADEKLFLSSKLEEKGGECVLPEIEENVVSLLEE
jgi:hypothetical protein